MCLKHAVIRALRSIVHRQTQMNLSSRFLFMRILKIVSALDELPSLESLRMQRFVKEKSYQTIIKEVEKLCKRTEHIPEKDAQSTCPTPGEPAGLELASNSHGVGEEDPGYYSDSSIIVCNQTQFQEISSNGSDCVVAAGTVSRNEEELFNSLSDLRLDSSRSSQQRVPVDGKDSDADVHGHAAKKRRYVPGYRTAPYAMLRALHEHDGAHKYLLTLKATQYTDTELDSSQALSALRTLARKGLVSEEGTRYHLTHEGSELCAMLFGDMRTPAEDHVTKLVIDCREKKSGKDRVFFQAHFLSRSIPCETRFLSVGDFLWVRNESVLGWVVERKQCTDFASSISDGRYREQKHRLKSLGMRVYYLVENLKVEDSKRSYVLRCLLETRMDGFVVMETESISESAWVLEMMDGRMRSGAYVPGLGVGDGACAMSYGSFLDETGKSSFRAGDMLLMALLGIKGLSKEFAVVLAGKYSTLCNFRKNIGSDVFVDEIKAFKVGRRELGERMARKIANMLH